LLKRVRQYCGRLAKGRFGFSVSPVDVARQSVKTLIAGKAICMDGKAVVAGSVTVSSFKRRGVAAVLSRNIYPKSIRGRALTQGGMAQAFGKGLRIFYASFCGTVRRCVWVFAATCSACRLSFGRAQPAENESGNFGHWTNEVFIRGFADRTRTRQVFRSWGRQLPHPVFPKIHVHGCTCGNGM